MINVLVVDDSVLYRKQIKLALSQIDNIKVVGASSNGRLALERIKLGGIDLVILDIEMPEMDGITTLKEMKELKIPLPFVIMFSTLSVKGGKETLKALSLGASDFCDKAFWWCTFWKISSRLNKITT